ncbi:hypothetical protein M3Y97_00093200 [Aphelenchoides bicaudatus]|nr:hypothetical protein M3Y97_00093200 [Aphelenchoides bicaudatus]
MGSIMRGDQTLRLIQLYYNNYPDIARNTQDADGRKARASMWQQITDELNNSYSTAFSVEQYKKKIQNVQCTSRQKIQAGKRNLGVAEFEYLRLFEQERLSTNTNNSSDAFESSITRSSSADISTNAKVEQMLEQFGINIDPQVFQQSALLSGQDIQETGSDSDSNTTTNSVVDANIPLSKSPPSFPQLASLSSHLDQRQLMIALSQLNQFNQDMRNNGPLNSTLNSQLAANFMSKPVTIDTLNTSEDKEEKQNRISPTIKRPFEENENLMRLFTSKKRRMNGIFGNQTVDDKWKRDMLELQQQILENQGKILDHMSKKPETPQTSDFTAIENKLEKLCDCIYTLNETLKDGLSLKKPQIVDVDE